jgi:hypothetical protein
LKHSPGSPAQKKSKLLPALFQFPSDGFQSQGGPTLSAKAHKGFRPLDGARLRTGRHVRRPVMFFVSISFVTPFALKQKLANIGGPC